VYNLRVTFDHWINDANAHHNTKLAAAVGKFQTLLLRPYEETALKVATK
jgi:hypothetical protein